MTPIDYLINILMSVFLIFGVYQFYFWCQRQRWVKVRHFASRLDEAIPYWPDWSWVYVVLYFPAILYLNLIVTSPRQYNHLAMSFFLLLFMHMAIFLVFPVETPPHWRSLGSRTDWSVRLMSLVQHLDAPCNCFPSMHVSVATLTALHARAAFGPWAYLFPVLISISCLFTKQHYIADLPFGVVLGWIAYRIFLCLG